MSILWTAMPIIPSVLLVFDVETSGLDARTHEILELASVCLVFDTKQRCYRQLANSEFKRFVRPQHAPSPHITRINGITPAMVAHAAPFARVFRDWQAHVERCVRRCGVCSVILVAHNARFDVEFLRQATQKLGQQELRIGGQVMGVIDSLQLARSTKKWPFPLLKTQSGLPSYRLASIYQAATNRQLEGAHSALADARAVATVLMSAPVANVLISNIEANIFVPMHGGRSGRCAAAASKIRKIPQLLAPAASNADSRNLNSEAKRARRRGDLAMIQSR